MSHRLIRSLNWIITDCCNLQCIHCDIWKKDQSQPSLDEIERFLEDSSLAASYEKYGSDFDISLGGGEPLDLINRYYPGSLKSVTSNGTLTANMGDFLKRCSHLDFKLNISIDGMADVHDRIRGIPGSFKKTLDTIKEVRKNYPHQRIEIKMALLPLNHNQILKVYKLSRKLGCDFSFKPAEYIKNYTNTKKMLIFDFDKAQICTIRNQCFRLSEIMYRKGDYRKARFYQDIPFYLSGKKKPVSCSVLRDHLTMMPDWKSFFCLFNESAGNVLANGIIGLSLHEDDAKPCSSCMLMCGSYKDYSSDYFERKTANIESTNRCNLDCDMCTQKGVRYGKPKNMPIEVFRNIIKIHSPDHVSFVGGEPFLTNNIFAMMQYLDKMGITYEVTTNGTLLDDSAVNRLKDCIGLRKVIFSLDGMREIHDNIRGRGVFDSCVSSLRQVKRFSEVEVSTVIRADNLEDIPLLSRYLAIMGIRKHRLVYGMDISKEAVRDSKTALSSISVKGPGFDASLKDPVLLKGLIGSMDKIEAERNITVLYEPALLKGRIEDFISGELAAKDKLCCRQLNQLRFDADGSRIVCEFIRNSYSDVLKQKISDRMLPICSSCCKLGCQEGKNAEDFSRAKVSVLNQNLSRKINLMVEPTNRCTLRCPTCFSHQDSRPKKDMSLAEFRKIIDDNLQYIGKISLYNYGEPLLNKSTPQMIRYAKEKGITFIKLATNALDMNSEVITFLLKSGLDLLSISLDGATSETYSKFRVGGDFDSVVHNISSLVEMRNKLDINLKIEIQFIIMNHNKHEIKDIQELAKKIGVDVLRLKRVLIKDNKWKCLLPGEKDYNRYHSNAKYDTCEKPTEELVINSDGTIVPCCYIVGQDIKKFSLGNIHGISIKEVIESQAYKMFVNKCVVDKNSNSCCADCEEGNLSLDYKVINLNGE